MRSKIAVVGEKDSVLGFKTVGFDVFETKGSQETAEQIHALAKQGYGIIFVTEEALLPVKEILNDYKEVMLPAIIPIPGIHGSEGIGLQNVHRSVERAVGADILFKG
ncbi:MAG TPA: V-type ATP synthase subunit F [Oscillospiraceae bacterium]|jgi:V/A-type H+-transporting ATPase subunit F|nr:V-type ATP synthase subunit F [Oscillospiraceae bacterium]HQQ88781.1 V-type ATP synthase subunit F [Oscillospiraceae bacterium]HRW56822.1 V-type ATP synthase subunit F [Oscillospiraceae bacterium]